MRAAVIGSRTCSAAAFTLLVGVLGPGTSAAFTMRQSGAAAAGRLQPRTPAELPFTSRVSLLWHAIGGTAFHHKVVMLRFCARAAIRPGRDGGLTVGRLVLQFALAALLLARPIPAHAQQPPPESSRAPQPPPS